MTTPNKYKQPLAPKHHDDRDSLDVDEWWLIERNCDPSMPQPDRERIARLIETYGMELTEQPKGEVGCHVCRKILPKTLRGLPADPIAAQPRLVWPVRLAHYVREHGLRISPPLLRERFGVTPGGRPIVMTHSPQDG